MAVTLASLRAAHPEFVDSPDLVVQAAIDSAVLRTESTIFGSQALVDEAVTWLACYLVSTSPYSRDKRRTATIDIAAGYLKEYEQICRAAGRAFRRISGMLS